MTGCERQQAGDIELYFYDELPSAALRSTSYRQFARRLRPGLSSTCRPAVTGQGSCVGWTQRSASIGT